jgi:hypothetical protein
MRPAPRQARASAIEEVGETVAIRQAEKAMLYGRAQVGIDEQGFDAERGEGGGELRREAAAAVAAVGTDDREQRAAADEPMLEQLLAQRPQGVRLHRARREQRLAEALEEILLARDRTAALFAIDQ